jgi:hypothetical protein
MFLPVEELGTLEERGIGGRAAGLEARIDGSLPLLSSPRLSLAAEPVGEAFWLGPGSTAGGAPAWVFACSRASGFSESNGDVEVDFAGDVSSLGELSSAAARMPADGDVE